MAASCASQLFISRLSALKLLPRFSALPVDSWSVPCGTREFHSSDALNGGRPKSFWRKKRDPANTRLNHELPEKIKERKAYGGHKKLKALRINSGTFTLKSCDVNLQSPIVSVVHSFANASHVERQVIVKGSIVQIDVSPFKAWCDSQVNDSQEKAGVPTADDDQKTQEGTPIISKEIKEMLDSGILLAKIDTRPGQVGACNGYILEGQELETLKNDLNLAAVQRN